MPTVKDLSGNSLFLDTTNVIVDDHTRVVSGTVLDNIETLLSNELSVAGVARLVTAIEESGWQREGTLKLLEAAFDDELSGRDIDNGIS